MGLGMAAADSHALPLEPAAVGGETGLGGVQGSRWLPAPSRGPDAQANGSGTGPGGSCDTLSQGLGKFAGALGGADTVRRRSADSDGQQCLGTTWARPGVGAEELLRLGFGLERPVSGDGVLDLCHVVDAQAQPAKMADVVLRAMCGGRGKGSGGHPAVLALEPD